MNLLTINGMKKSYTDRILFNDAEFSIAEGEKVGVIGVNGTGKTTLLNIASGIETPDAGFVTKGNKVKISYLCQNPVVEKGRTIFEHVMKGNSDEGEAKSILNKLGFSDCEITTDFLSVGQKKRVALAAILLIPCDILILDEPTNHMDNEMAAWLESYLKSRKQALIMVTHDRYFLDNVVNRIVEIDNGKIYNYKGGYQDFLEQKTLREDIETAEMRKRKSILKVELEWIQRGAKARSTKQKAHIKRYEELRDADTPQVKETLQMNSMNQRMGKKTIEVKGLAKSYDGKVLFKDFNYIFLNGDRIGIVGKNGCGKSTLMKIICGKVGADAGTIEMGSTVKIGYFTQENENLPEDIRVIDYINSSQMLNRFLFDDTLQYQTISRLSGGEKRRLYLLKILMDAPNVLVLDEPTNDLDIQTMAIFEEYLQEFDGIVIAVSHDRYFLNKVTSRIFAFSQSGMIKQYEGNYDDYISKIDMEEEKEIPNTKEKKLVEKPKSEKIKMSFNEKYEFERIDGVIAVLEEEINRLEKEITLSSTDFIKLNALMKERDEKQLELDMKMERWVYLNELNEKVCSLLPFPPESVKIK